MIVRNLLVVAAHPDDAELMAGGTIAKVTRAGGKVRVVNLTDGEWCDPEGMEHRTGGRAVKEGEEAARVLGYEVDCLYESAMRLEYEDRIVCQVLKIVERFRPDLLIVPWTGDAHRDHRIAAEIGLACARTIPRVLMGEINWYVHDEAFQANVFVDVTDTYPVKIQALRCYRSEMDRRLDSWMKYLDSRSVLHGLVCGCQFAEGFRAVKFTL